MIRVMQVFSSMNRGGAEAMSRSGSFYFYYGSDILGTFQ